MVVNINFYYEKNSLSIEGYRELIFVTNKKIITSVLKVVGELLSVSYIDKNVIIIKGKIIEIFIGDIKNELQDKNEKG